MKIQDAQVIEEFEFNAAKTTPLNDSFFDRVIAGLDKITKGNRAVPFAEALIISGVVTDSKQLRALTTANKAELNKYFDLIDLNKFIDIYTPGIEKKLQEKVQDIAIPLAVGTGLGIAGTIVFNKYVK